MSRTSLASDRFLSLQEIATQLGGKSVDYLRKVAQDQHGQFKEPRYSMANKASYPRFEKGPGNRWGCWLSTWERWRETNSR